MALWKCIVSVISTDIVFAGVVRGTTLSGPQDLSPKNILILRKPFMISTLPAAIGRHLGVPFLHAATTPLEKEIRHE